MMIMIIIQKNHVGDDFDVSNEASDHCLTSDFSVLEFDFSTSQSHRFKCIKCFECYDNAQCHKMN